MSGRTLFQKIIEGEIPSHQIGRGDGWYAFLDIFPRRAGHTLVIPEKPVIHISELNEEETSRLFNGLQIVQNKLSKFFKTNDFTICIHDGPLAGQEVPHSHIHVIPRTEGDGGLSLMSMWPKTRNDSEPHHDDLASLAKNIQELAL